MSIKDLVKRPVQTQTVVVEDLTFVIREPLFMDVKASMDCKDEDGTIDPTMSDLILTASCLQSISSGDKTQEGPFEVEDIQELYEHISIRTHAAIQGALGTLMTVGVGLGKP